MEVHDECTSSGRVQIRPSQTAIGHNPGPLVDLRESTGAHWRPGSALWVFFHQGTQSQPLDTLV